MEKKTDDSTRGFWRVSQSHISSICLLASRSVQVFCFVSVSVSRFCSSGGIHLRFAGCLHCFVFLDSLLVFSIRCSVRLYFLMDFVLSSYNFVCHRSLQLYACFSSGASFAHTSQGVRNPVGVFSGLEEAARDEILLAGGSLSHHHGIGKSRAGERSCSRLHAQETDHQIFPHSVGLTPHSHFVYLATRRRPLSGTPNLAAAAEV